MPACIVLRWEREFNDFKELVTRAMREGGQRWAVVLSFVFDSTRFLIQPAALQSSFLIAKLRMHVGAKEDFKPRPGERTPGWPRRLFQMSLGLRSKCRRSSRSSSDTGRRFHNDRLH